MNNFIGKTIDVSKIQTQATKAFTSINISLRSTSKMCSVIIGETGCKMVKKHAQMRPCYWSTIPLKTLPEEVIKYEVQ
jgi:hypothetical protein